MSFKVLPKFLSHSWEVDDVAEVMLFPYITRRKIKGEGNFPNDFNLNRE